MTNPDAHPTLPADELLRHARWLRGLARSLVLDDAEADDLVQETWLQALTQDRSGLRDPRAWLAGVARNVARNRGRSSAARRARERSSARSEAVPDGQAGQEVLDRQRALLDRVDALEEPYRATLLARYFEELPPRAIARRDGVPVATVKSRLARALDRLRRDLDAEHGDRREWALWLLPLARGAKTAALASRVALSVATVVGLAAGVVLVLALRDDGPDAAPIVPEGPAELVAVAREQAGEVAQEPEAGRAPRVEATSSSLLVRVLDGSGGPPREGALVRYLDGADLERAGERTLELYPDMERLAFELGREARTDVAGEARLTGRAPWVVLASSGARVAAGGGENEMAELELHLAPAPRVGARVEDDRGRPVAGVPVIGKLEIDAAIPGREAETWEFERVTGADGEVWFLDPMGFWSVPGEAREGRTATWSEFRIGLPGVPESTRGGVAHTDYGEAVAGEDLAPVRLVLPPTGVLEVVVVDSGGEDVAVDGTVVLQALGGRATRNPERYEAALSAGRASYPRAALGLRYRASVRVPELGATWDAEGAGPLSAGERVVLEVPRPSSRVWTATIVDEEGRAVAGARATLYLEDSASRYGPRQVGPLRTDAAGLLRVELPAEAEPLGGFFFDVWHGVERAGVDGIVAGEPARARVDLGRHVARFGPTPVVRGRCVDPSGAPLGGISVSAPARSGITNAAYTEADGSFKLSSLFPERVELEVVDHEGVWLLQGPPPVATLDGDEVVVVLVRGASLRAQLVLPELLDTFEGWWTLAYQEGAEEPKWGELSPSGELRFEGLGIGTYRVELRMLGNAPLVAVAGVQVAGGENHDARIDAIDLGALLRPVRVTAVDPEGRKVAARVVVADQDVLLHQGQPGASSILVPTAPGWSLLVAAPGWRVQDLGEVTLLGDEVEVELRPGLEVELVPRGANAGAGDWSWAAEGALSRVAPAVSIPDAIRAGEARVLRFAAAGTYRLIQETTSRHGDMMSVGRTETPITIEVRGDLEGVQRVEFDWE